MDWASGIVGFGSLAAAIAAVVVGWRANRAAKDSVSAAQASVRAQEKANRINDRLATLAEEANRIDQSLADIDRRLLGIEDDRTRREEEGAIRAQAAHIAVWVIVKGKPRDPDAHWGIVVANSSDACVYGLKVTVPKWGTPLECEVVPPGRWYHEYELGTLGQMWFAFPIALEAAPPGLTPASKNSGYLPEVTFVDADGLAWKRDRKGVLVQVPTEAG